MIVINDKSYIRSIHSLIVDCCDAINTTGNVNDLSSTSGKVTTVSGDITHKL